MTSIKRTEQLFARLDELEGMLRGELTDDYTRADILDEIAEIEGELDGNGD